VSIDKEKAHDIILEMLLENPGAFVSGEKISERLGFTRAALWKHMRTLQLEQWPIESVTRNGYRIIKGQKIPFSKAGIIQNLREIGNVKNIKVENNNENFWDISVLESVDSTNNRIKELAYQSDEGTVVFAKKQTGGRGRIGREWSSKENMGLWMSILLKPEVIPSQVQAITLAASVAMVMAIKQIFTEDSKIDEPTKNILLQSFGIKWPNDILWNGRKICGILTELAAEPEKLHYVILGIGLNVFHTEKDFPEELQKTAVSLNMMQKSVKYQSSKESDISGMTGCLEEYISEDLDLNRIAARVLHNMQLVYQDFLKNGMVHIVAQWRENSITLGKKILVLVHEPWEAKAVDVLENGQLIVENDQGDRIELLSGEISIRTVDKIQI